MNRKKALAICDAAEKRFTGSYGAEECKQLANMIKEKYISFSIPQVNMPGKPFTILLQFQNMDKAYIRILKADPEKYENESGYEYYNKLPQAWSTGVPLKEWAVDLPKETDYQTHSAEIKMPALSSGFYMVLVSPNEKFTCNKNLVAYGGCWESNIKLR